MIIMVVVFLYTMDIYLIDKIRSRSTGPRTESRPFRHLSECGISPQLNIYIYTVSFPDWPVPTK